MSRPLKSYSPDVHDFENKVHRKYDGDNVETPGKRLTLQQLFTISQNRKNDPKKTIEDTIDNLRNAEKCYITFSAIVMAHGPNATAVSFEGKENERVSGLLKIHREELEEVYTEYGITNGEATFKQAIRSLDSIAASIAEELKPGCTKVKNG